MDKQRTLVIFRDCHAAHRIAVRCTDTMDERFVRRFAQRMGWPCCIRKAEVQPAAKAAPAENNWRKPAAIIERPRPQLFGAFTLTLTASAAKGGEL